MAHGLATDLYQLTMAAGYAHHGLSDVPACFHLFFRRPPFGGAYAVAAGLEDVRAFIEGFAVDGPELEFLAARRGADGAPLFEESFLEWLAELRLTVDVDAVPEGTPVFPRAPMLRLSGPLAQCQLVETAILSIVGFQTLVATKAARIVRAAAGRAVLEFGARRAHGVEAALSASRAAYIGGVAATSNARAGHRFGIPVRGTHAHSWVMAFADEARAFEAYCEAMPANAVLLVDTYEVERGIDRAVAVGVALRAKGHSLNGIRLDSGDLGSLAGLARHRLDAAGLFDAKIYASNDLDEHSIHALLADGAPIDAFGVGTRLVTGGDQGALGAVYKLGAILVDGHWEPRAKLAGGSSKATLPGRIGVDRSERHGRITSDELYDLDRCPGRRDLLRPAIRSGRRVGAPVPLATLRERSLAERSRLPEEVARLTDPEPYSVRVGPSLTDTSARNDRPNHTARSI